MGLSLITPPSLDPVSLAEVKAHCRITSTEDDGLLAGYILAARAHAETYTRRSFISQVWELTLDEWPRKCGRRVQIVLPRPPTLSVSSVEYVDTTGDVQTLPADQYGLIKLDTGEQAIVPAYGVTWPALRDQASAVTVTYVAGYGTQPGSIPEPIRQAMLLLIGHWYESREAINVGNIVNEMPFGVEALLSPYRVFY